ncbi:Uncharacterised protein [Mycobacterium tuberculosis]|uniref:Uncharacterized protein n=1 Tax=Mycobacterium tuberculosis TaxID=1773 RepID=A0A0U0T5K7_MYCTX|nr:Uncharacterised protein [Mycobacterium tuberculosis]CKR95249.1 Uncharacterised protein [Mycobacterium tuberculosis]CNN06650.1 Uncharacterised protein [Mycobacterium tuberculosis]CNV35118.1 Uncharacterised protein [Mycobacterium tuberculosis]COX29558.1 Uncharacterised protein [Mycobacterium tuberculosis]
MSPKRSVRLRPANVAIRCDTGTALGFPLVPDVKIIMNGSIVSTSR